MLHPHVYKALLIALVSATPLASAEMVLVDDGRPAATIVIAGDAGEKVRHAADELQTYVEKMSGAVLPIATDDEGADGPLLLVGPSRLTDEMQLAIPSGLTNARREEGFVIISRPGRLVVAGNNDGPYHGTEYAVYELLHRLGVRWFMPGEYGEVVPHRETVVVPELSLREEPDFIMRNWWLHTTPELAEEERAWKLRNGMSPDRMFATPSDSSARRILPAAQYFEEHPEYFAMNADGSRNPHMPNLTHPRAAEIAAGIITEHFREHPDANSYGFAPDDGLPRDYSPETVALNLGFPTILGRPGVPAEMSTTEEWFHFVNRVTGLVREEFPDVYIATNGYANRNTPPEGLELDDHLVVMFAAIWSCTLHAYDDPHCWQKVRQGRMLKRWCELCDNVWIYGYNYQMLVSGLTPLPEFTKLRRDFPLMHRWGVIGFLDETRNVWAECGIASRYLRARLEWDAEADVDAILDDFFGTWYGRAGEPMKRYYLALDAAIATAPLHLHEDRALAELYAPALMDELRGHLRAAEERVEDDRCRAHVEADRLIHEHLEAYVRMWQAWLDGDFAGAAQHAERMLSLRRQLHAIDPFYIWPDEEGYRSGVWYWTVTDRRDLFRSLAHRTSGRTGELVAMCPTRVRFRTDPHDEGRFAGWQRPGWDDGDWERIDTRRPFYLQGHIDREGHPYVGNMWYRLRVEVPASAAGSTVRLCVPMVSAEAWCWVNGEFVGHRPYQEPYIRPADMQCDVTAALTPGRTNLIALRVNTGLSEAGAAEGLYSRPFLYAPTDQAPQ
ncbi:MAG: DUF4838 domain-containing protein [Armatimonadota bacterium]